MVGIWLEHLLLLGPALNHGISVLPLGIQDGIITLGFLGLLLMALTFFVKIFPECIYPREEAA
jgi:hypothetical protein